MQGLSLSDLKLQSKASIIINFSWGNLSACVKYYTPVH